MFYQFNDSHPERRVFLIECSISTALVIAVTKTKIGESLAT